MIIQYILAYKYLILLPFSIIEGPFLAVICGFLVTTKILNPWIVLPIVIVGDIIGDSILYFVGRTGKKALRFFRVKEESLEEAKKYFAFLSGTHPPPVTHHFLFWRQDSPCSYLGSPLFILYTYHNSSP